MEGMSKKYVLGLPSFNRSPFSPRTFTTTTRPTTLPAASDSCELGRQQLQPNLTNHGEADRNNTKSHLESLEGTTHLPSLDYTVSDDRSQIPPLLYRNPIKIVMPSLDNHGGITVKTELGIDYEMSWRRNMDPNIDDKKFRRIIYNRISAKKSRLRKLQYINDLEQKKKDLQLEVALLASRVESEKEQQKQLQIENHFLKERMIISEDKAKLSLAVVEENRKVIRRLKELYAAQQNMNIQIEKETPLMMSPGNTKLWSTSTRVNEQVMGDSISRENEGNEADPIVVEDQDLNLNLNLNSLTNINPPNSLI